VEILTAAIRQGATRPVSIPDVRHVPLEQLATDAECDQVIRRIMTRQGSTSRTDVAMFNSAI
jgi:FXSXX-COOH protein